MRVAALCFALGGLAGCEEHPGRLLVVVDTDYEIPIEINCLRATFSLDGEDAGVTPPTKEFRLRRAGDPETPRTYALPLSFVVRPKDGDSSRRVRIDLSLHESCEESAANDPLFSTHRVVRGFVPNETRVVPVHVSRACAPVSDCATYCQYGRCAPTEVLDPHELPRATSGGREMDALDAGPAAPMFTPFVADFPNMSTCVIAGAPDHRGFYYAGRGTGVTSVIARFDWAGARSSVLGTIRNADVSAVVVNPAAIGAVAPTVPLAAFLVSYHDTMSQEFLGGAAPVPLYQVVLLKADGHFTGYTNATFGPWAEHGGLSWVSNAIVMAGQGQLAYALQVPGGPEGRFAIPSASVPVWSGAVASGADAYTLHNAAMPTSGVLLSHVLLMTSTVGTPSTVPIAHGMDSFASYDAALDGESPPRGVWIAGRYSTGPTLPGVLAYVPTAVFDHPDATPTPTFTQLGDDRNEVHPNLIQHVRGTRFVVGGSFHLDATFTPTVAGMLAPPPSSCGAWLLAMDCTAPDAASATCAAIPNSGFALVGTDCSSVTAQSLAVVDGSVLAAVRVTSDVSVFGHVGGATYDDVRVGASVAAPHIVILRMPP